MRAALVQKDSLPNGCFYFYACDRKSFSILLPLLMKKSMKTHAFSVQIGEMMQSFQESLRLIKRVWSLLLGHFTNDFYANLLPAMLPIVLVKFDLTLAMVGFLASSFLTIGAFSQLLFGVISDRFTQINFPLVGVGITGVFFSLAGLAPSYWWVLAAVSVAGLGSAMFHPKATAETGALSSDQRGLTLALFIACGTAGFSFAPIASALVYDSLGLEGGSWLFLALIGVAIAFFAWAMPASRPVSKKKQPTHWADAMKILIIPWLIVVFRHAAYLSLMTYTIILLEARGLSYISASFGLSLFLLAGVFGIVAGGPLSDRYGRKPVTMLSLAVALPSLLLFLHTGGWVSFLFLFVGGFSLIMNNPVVVAYAQERLPHHASTASAITMGFGWGIGALMVGPIGALADHWGIVAAMDLVVASLLGAVVLSFGLHSKENLAQNRLSLGIKKASHVE